MTSSAGPGPVPVTLVELELTSDCRPPCQRCDSYHGTIHSADTVTIGQWQKVIAGAADLAVELVRFTGARSALFPDLVEYALSLGVKVDVHSPLVHVAEGMWELFARPGVSLGICWYAADALQHAEITETEGSWYRARQNAVKALDRGLAPRAEVVTVIDGQRIRHARAELHRLGIDVITLDRARSAFLAFDGRLPGQAGLCAGCGIGRAGVTWYGAVVPCIVLGRHLTVGNVKNSPFADILSGPRWAEVVASIPRAGTPGMCTGADHVECARGRS
jgi:MoaA/NifB/PqqE/SkfB family radical SAM enzyme